MGRWERTHHDASVTGRRPVGHSDGADAVRLPPVHLDLDDEPEPDTDDNRPWQRWFGIALALIVAAVAGVIVTNARHDAADRARVELIGGEATASFAGRPDPEVPAWEADFMVFNAGRQPVEIVTFGLPGWTTPAGAEAAETVTARPGTWTRVRARLTPDCSRTNAIGETDTDLVATGLVRNDGDESTVPIRFAPGPPWFRDIWATTCSAANAPHPDVVVTEVDVLPSPAGRQHVRTRLSITIPDGGGEATLIRVWSHVAGFGSEAGGLPVAIHSGEVVPVDLDWVVTGCDAVEDMETAQLSLHLATNGAAGARLRSAPVPDRVLVELGKLSAQVCGL